MSAKKNSPYDLTTCKILMTYSAMSIIGDFMPDVKHHQMFNGPDTKKWTDNTIRYCNLMVSRLEKSVAQDGEETKNQMIGHMHHVQKLVALISRLDTDDIRTVTRSIESFMEEHYEPKVYQSVLS
jgi:hypothetical protein